MTTMQQLTSALNRLRGFSGRFTAREKVWRAFDTAHQSPFSDEAQRMRAEGDGIEASVIRLLDQAEAEGVPLSRLVDKLRRGIKGLAVTQSLKTKLIILDGMSQPVRSR